MKLLKFREGDKTPSNMPLRGNNTIFFFFLCVFSLSNL
nr:MAG TPA: hypothetical protein [Caudoviricetes sp.]